MIEITFNPKNFEIKATGHAKHDVKGKDIVCSAISTLFYTLAQTLFDSHDMLEALDVDDKNGDGFIGCTPKEEYIGNIACIYRTILIGMEMVANEYPKNVKFKVLEEI